jgi:hypothetical protein
MPKVLNDDTKAVTPLPMLQSALANLAPGEKVHCGNTKAEILKTRENLTRRRAEIPGADSHLEYIEAMLIAEAEGKLQFRS